MVHAQKPDFVFRRNEPSQFKSAGVASVRSTTGSRGVRNSGSNTGYTMFRGSVKGTDYPLHSPVSPSLTLPCVTVCHHISTGLHVFCVYCSLSYQAYKPHAPYYIVISGLSVCLSVPHFSTLYYKRQDFFWKKKDIKCEF